VPRVADESDRKALQPQLPPRLAPTEAAARRDHADKQIAAVGLVATAIGQPVALPASEAAHGHRPGRRKVDILAPALAVRASQPRSPAAEVLRQRVDRRGLLDVLTAASIAQIQVYLGRLVNVRSGDLRRPIERRQLQRDPVSRLTKPRPRYRPFWTADTA
jgi:hypothetical protein